MSKSISHAYHLGLTGAESEEIEERKKKIVKISAIQFEYDFDDYAVDFQEEES